LLNFTRPNYAHVPVATNIAGEKLSKQTLAQPIPQGNFSQTHAMSSIHLVDARLASELIVEALHFLGQMPPAEIKNASIDECWRWAINHWNLAKVPKQTHIRIIE
jgi:glutamyl-Q tRNA(Asp) synthetase